MAFKWEISLWFHKKPYQFDEFRKEKDVYNYGVIVYVLDDTLVEIPDIVNLVGSVWKQVVVQIDKIIVGHACHEINDNLIRILT